MKLYKLTDRNNKTRAGEYNECQWGENITHSGTGVGALCGPGYIHAYTDPLLAVLFNPIHANIKHPVGWECEGNVAINDRGIKVGCVTLTTVRVIELPIVTTSQRVAIGILCALGVYKDSIFVHWANAWLDGTDRTANAAANAAAHARIAAAHARIAAAHAAANAAIAAADAADAAANAAAHARIAASNGAIAGVDAANAAIAAADDADAAAHDAAVIDLIALAKAAMEVK
jgi:hypothetical protein